MAPALVHADYAVVPGSADNSVHLVIECPADWRVAADLVSLPPWVSRADLTCNPGPHGADVRITFDVASGAPVGERDGLVLALQARDPHGQPVAATLRRLPLKLATIAPQVQQSFQIEECCVPTAGIGGASSGHPDRNLLIGAAPNPWSELTAIRFGLPVAASVSLRILDVSGRVVYQMRTPELSAGYHQVEWDGLDAIGQPVAPGLYFYELSAGAWMATGKTLHLH
jgi:hypothetical protein